MDAQDLSQHRQIRRLTRLTQELQRSRTPRQTLDAFHRGFAEEDELLASLLLSTRGLGPNGYRIISMRLPDDPHGGGFDPEGPDAGPGHSGGIVHEIVACARPQLIQDVDWSPDPFFRGTLGGYRSVIAIPFPGDRLPLNWVLLLRKTPQRFTVSDLVDALERVALGGALMENQMLAADLARANEQIDREARRVGDLQRALLPASVPQVAGLEIATSYEPTGRAGGDSYDVFRLNQDCAAGATPAPARWCMLIGDASGHGLAAAVVMAIVQAVLHAHPAGAAGPATLLMHANRQLCDKQIGGFFTAFLGVYEPVSRRLTYANAGHPPPLLKRAAGGSVRALDAVGSYPLGIVEAEKFEEAAVTLEAGDSVLLYTDGITEARDASGDLFSQKRLTLAFGNAGGRPAEVIDRLRAAVHAHQHGQPAPDDQTLVLARVL
jgi:sigma-B regulation protein RsbU (phosphoserine phosphatase)